MITKRCCTKLKVTLSCNLKFFDFRIRIVFCKEPKKEEILYRVLTPLNKDLTNGSLHFIMIG